MVKQLSVINGLVMWDELVGLEYNLKDYKVIVIGYYYQDNKILIAEYRQEGNYTNEILTVDTEKTIEILKTFDIYVELVEKFAWSNQTIEKARGLKQAGFNTITYDIDKRTSLLNNSLEFNIFTSEEILYIETIMVKYTEDKSNIIINLDDIR